MNFTVENQVVTLSGTCPTADMRMKVNDKVKNLYGVKDLVNNIVVAPVIIGTDRALKLSVDSVLKDYPAVQAIVNDSVVALEGRVEGSKANQLLAAIQTLNPRMLENRMVMK